MVIDATQKVFDRFQMTIAATEKPIDEPAEVIDKLRNLIDESEEVIDLPQTSKVAVTDLIYERFKRPGSGINAWTFEVFASVPVFRIIP